MTEGVNTFIFAVTAQRGKQSGMLSEATLEPTRSESDMVTLYMKLVAVSAARNFFCYCHTDITFYMWRDGYQLYCSFFMWAVFWFEAFSAAVMIFNA